MSRDSNAAGLSINWQIFGSNNLEVADYSKGVLERFTRRAPKDWEFMLHSQPIGGNPHVKTILNPRMASCMDNAHNSNFFEGKYSVNEDGKIVWSFFSKPIAADKIVINHYFKKSREEYEKKVDRGKADRLTRYRKKPVDFHNCNDEFDDGILKYRDERTKVYQPPDTTHANERLLTALAKNLSPMILPTVPPSFYKGKLETFLTCRAVSNYLQGKFPNDKRLIFYEEASLKAMLKSFSGMTFADAQLLLSELPNLLTLPYPEVNDLRGVCLQIIPQMMKAMHLSNLWKDYVELDYLQRLLKNFWR